MMTSATRSAVGLFLGRWSRKNPQRASTAFKPPSNLKGKTVLRSLNAGSVGVFDQPFQEAANFLRQKAAVPTRSYRDVWDAAHSKMFMVAGAQSEALVKDFQDAVARAIETGSTLDDFRKDFDKIVATHGWQYNGTRGWRSQIIFETNLSTAYAAGRYAKLSAPDTLRQFPGWQYNHSGAKHPRLQHKAWDGRIWPANDPIWNEIFPPNGYRCGCFVTPVSGRAINRKGGYDSIPNLDQLGTDQPAGVDPSFAYNPGHAWLARTAPGPKAVTASEVQIARFVKAALRGKWPDGSWTPVGIARGMTAEALDVASKTEIRLSASTIRSHTHHDKISADTYATLPKWLLENGELVTDANGRQAFVGEYQGKHYHAGVKVVHKNGYDEIYLTSLRRTEQRKIQRLKRK